MLERDLLDQLYRYMARVLKTRPHQVRKVHGSNYQRAGEPDLDAVVDGVPVKAEVKVPGKHPTPLQAKRLREWAEAGAVTGCVHSVEELDTLLVECFRRAENRRIGAAYAHDHPELTEWSRT